ncbi:hypothetical protein [Janthinobacterium lividum]|uniref:hypothetical protein n=1 Tax=Janthinobacterium lividum TaxID=29581 RepID=UPI001114978B|nr:hypothetical protein [Janthinobacterium lividum]
MAGTVPEVKMNNHLRMLLRLIDTNSDSTFLLSQGLTYSQISELFSTATRNGYINHDGDNFLITKQGRNFLSEKAILEKYGSIGAWITPDERYQIPQTKVSDIYLPKLSDSKHLAA